MCNSKDKNIDVRDKKEESIAGSLISQLDAINEGEVVSFADFKAKKDGESTEEPKTDGKKHVEIVEVTFKWKEGDQKSNDILEIGSIL